MAEFEDSKEGIVMDPDTTMTISQPDDETTQPTNARKRKKSSRACDFCHVNHQPCDNAKPRCGYCEKHGKSCLYLRPQKKRGPAQGYRSALHTLRESAAAWGAALNLIPSLGPVIEGYLKQEQGQRLVKAIRDPAQQEFFIQSWQQSSVFRAFFGEDEASNGVGQSHHQQQQQQQQQQTPPQPQQALPHLPQLPLQGLPTGSPGMDVDLYQQQQAMLQTSTSIPTSLQMPPIPPTPSMTSMPQMSPVSQIPDALDDQFDVPLPNLHLPPSRNIGASSHRIMKASQNHGTHQFGRTKPRQDSISMSDILAKDAARSSAAFSQTLGPLGFAPTEGFDDFLAMSFNPEEPDMSAIDADPGMSSDQDQKAYYELLMGRQFVKDSKG